MKCLPLIGLFFLVSCAYSDVPDPSTTKGQLIVELKTLAKSGLKNLSALGGGQSIYGDRPLANKYKRVNYRSFPDIAVWLSGGQLQKSTPDRETVLTVGDSGAEQRLIVLPANSTLVLNNQSNKELCLYSQDNSGGFEAVVAPSSQKEVIMREVGEHTLYCDENEELKVTLVVTPNDYTRVGEGGEYVTFESVPPGTYTLNVKAVRLPLHQQQITLKAGQRHIQKVTLGVHQIKNYSK